MLWVSIEHSAKSFYKQRNIILYPYSITPLTLIFNLRERETERDI